MINIVYKTASDRYHSIKFEPGSVPTKPGKDPEFALRLLTDLLASIEDRLNIKVESLHQYNDDTAETNKLLPTTS